MNVLPPNKQIAAVAALTEGCSIRATERLTGIHRDTVMRLGVRVGEGCARLHDRLMRDLNIPILECDEIWSYVGKKQRRTTPDERHLDVSFQQVVHSAPNEEADVVETSDFQGGPNGHPQECSFDAA